MGIINKLTFVKKHHEGGDVYSFYFTKPKSFRFSAGQHGVFFFAGLYRPHPFSYASAPEESELMISTHVGSGSPFKKKLESLSEGDSFYMFGPLLWFTFLPTAQKYVFLAQGIGITPFRSLLVSNASAKKPFTTTLIHVDGKEHAFKEETLKAATGSTFYVSDPDAFRAEVAKQDVKQMFYLSGSPRFVSSTRELLRSQGVAARHIKTDSFLGY